MLVGLVSLTYAFYAPANADDYCRASLPQSLTWWEHVTQVYRDWSGRWAVHSFYVLVFPHLDITSPIYNLLVALSPLIWCAIFFIFLHVLFGVGLTSGEKAFLSILLCAVYWVGMPAPGETWYWLTGSIEYQLPFLLMALCLLALSSFWTGSREAWRLAVAVIAGAVLALLVTGLNELVALLLLGMLVIGAALAVVQRRWDVAIVLAAVTAVTIAGLAFNVSAPGTAVRAARDFPNHNDFVYAIRLTLLEPAYAPLSWLSDARLIWLSIALIASPWFLARMPAWTQWTLPGPKSLSKWFIVVPLITLVAVHLAALAVNFAQGAPAFARVSNMIYGAFVIGLMASLAAFAPVARASMSGHPARLLSLIAGIMLPISLVTAPNVMRAIADLPRVVTVWSPALVARDAEIRAHAAEDAIDLAQIEEDPRLFYWDELASDPADWRNMCFARYYGVHSISVPRR